jgi:hypothetical protein
MAIEKKEREHTQLYCKSNRAAIIANSPTTIEILELYVDWLLIEPFCPGEMLVMANLSINKESPRAFEKMLLSGLKSAVLTASLAGHRSFSEDRPTD